MPGWDYSGNGIYFITMIIQNRECLLGKIENNEIIFSDFGKIAKNEWYKSFEIRQELILDEFVIMPNHLHAIVIIDKTMAHGTRVETHGRASLQSEQSEQPEQTINQSQFYRKPKSLSSFIAGYKSAVTTKINNWIDNHNREFQQYILKFNRNNRLWQPNYHDHIIRHDDEYWRIKNYINSNPENWSDDEFYEI